MRKHFMSVYLVNTILQPTEIFRFRPFLSPSILHLEREFLAKVWFRLPE